jgi:hypothetical protein
MVTQELCRKKRVDLTNKTEKIHNNDNKIMEIKESKRKKKVAFDFTDGYLQNTGGFLK